MSSNGSDAHQWGSSIHDSSELASLPKASATSQKPISRAAPGRVSGLFPSNTANGGFFPPEDNYSGQFSHLSLGGGNSLNSLSQPAQTSPFPVFPPGLGHSSPTVPQLQPWNPFFGASYSQLNPSAASWQQTSQTSQPVFAWSLAQQQQQTPTAFPATYQPQTYFPQQMHHQYLQQLQQTQQQPVTLPPTATAPQPPAGGLPVYGQSTLPSSANSSTAASRGFVNSGETVAVIARASSISDSSAVNTTTLGHSKGLPTPPAPTATTTATTASPITTTSTSAAAINTNAAKPTLPNNGVTSIPTSPETADTTGSSSGNKSWVDVVSKKSAAAKKATNTQTSPNSASTSTLTTPSTASSVPTRPSNAASASAASPAVTTRPTAPSSTARPTANLSSTIVPALPMRPVEGDAKRVSRPATEYNPKNFNCKVSNARFFVIKSFSEDDVHKSIKYGVWASTEQGNRRLDEAYRTMDGAGPIYLLFSVNKSGHFCGIAEMTSPVDYKTDQRVWASQGKFKGTFTVHWIFVKDVPSNRFRNVINPWNEDKPIFISRDTTEMPTVCGQQVLTEFVTFAHNTSVFDDFTYYDEREEKMVAGEPVAGATGSSESKPAAKQPYTKKNW